MRNRTVMIITAASLLLSACGAPSGNHWEELYSEAVKDTVTIEKDEILPIQKISPDNDMIEYNEEGQVLMVTMHRYPDSYIAGTETELKYGEIWVTSLPELKQWYQRNKDSAKAENMTWGGRFEMLLGMPADGSHTHFTAMWADPKDMVRPAYNPDITSAEVKTGFTQEEIENSNDYKQWFDGNIVWSYFDSAYPWTRLGYTYDYADNGTEYGLSEYLVNDGAKVRVEFTYTVDEMVEYLNQQ